MQGVLLALLERERSGHGQLVDVAMVDGAAHLATFVHALRRLGAWDAPRGRNLLDGGRPWYRCYRAKCGGFVAVGPLEERFYRLMLRGLGLDPAELPPREDSARWPELERIFAAKFAERTRDEWAARFAAGSELADATVSPVLELDEAPRHAHAVARGAFDAEGRPAACPRLSRTPGAGGAGGGGVVEAGTHTVDVFREWAALPERRVDALLESVALYQNIAAKL